MKFEILVSVVSIIFCESLIGVMPSWGQILPYTLSYLKLHDDFITSSSMSTCYCALFVAEILVLVLLTDIIKYIGLKSGYQLGTIIIGICFTIIGCTNNLWIVILSYLGLGFGYSLNTISINFICVGLMPANPGMAAFFAMVGQDLTPIQVSFLIQLIINPLNLEPTIVVTEGQKVFKCFDHEVADNVPMFFKTYGIIIVVVGIIVPFFFIKDKMDTTNKVVENSRKNSKDTSLDVSDCSNEQSNLLKIGQFCENTNLSIEKSYVDERGIEVNYIVPNIPYTTISGPNFTLDISKSLTNSRSLSRKNSSILKEMTSLEVSYTLEKSSKKQSINLSQTDNDANPEVSIDQKVQEIIKTQKFWQYFFLVSFTYGVTNWMLNYFTTLCQLYHTQTTASYFSSYTSFILIISRLAFGIALDATNNKTVFSIFLLGILIAIITLSNFINILTLFYFSYTLFYSMSTGAAMMTIHCTNKEYGIDIGLQVLIKRFGYAYVMTSVFAYIFDFLVRLISQENVFIVIIITACLSLILQKFSV